MKTRVRAKAPLPPTLPCQSLTFSHTSESLIVGICCELHRGRTSATGSLQHGTDGNKLAALTNGRLVSFHAW